MKNQCLFLILVSSFASISWQYVHIPLNIGPNLPFTPINSSHNSSGLKPIFQNFSKLINEVGTEPYQGYYISLLLGTPEQNINVLLDTGSSTFAVAGRSFPEVERYFDSARSTSYTSLHKTIFVKYTQGEWYGTLGSDMVSVRSEKDFLNGSNHTEVPPLRITFSSITTADNFFLQSSKWEGIVGLAFDKLGRQNDQKYDTFYTTLVKTLSIPDIFSILLCGTTAKALKASLNETQRASQSHSAFIAGGIDPSLFKGKIMYTPVVQAEYFDIVLTNITINGVPVQEDCKELNFDKAIVDTGTTNIRFPTRVYKNVIALLKEHIDSLDSQPFNMEESFWTRETLLCIPLKDEMEDEGLIGESPYIYFPNIVFTAMGENSTTVDISLSPQQYINYLGPRNDMNRFGQRNCFVLGIQPSDTGTIIGSVFQEGFYVVFDRVNERVGWAQSTCNQYTLSNRVAVSNVSQQATPFSPYKLHLPDGQIVSISKPIHCAYHDNVSFYNLEFLTNLAVIIMTIIGLILLLPLSIFFCFLHFSDFKHFRSNIKSANDNTNEHNVDLTSDDQAYLTANQAH